MVDLWALNPCWLFGRSLFSINNKKVMPVEQICEKNFSVDSHNPNTSNHPTKYRGVISIGLFWFLTTRPFEIRPSKSLDFRSLTFYIRFLNALAFKKTESKSFFRAPLLGRADNWPASYCLLVTYFIVLPEPPGLKLFWLSTRHAPW